METHIGKIEHDWPKAHAAAVDLDEAAIRVGDLVRIVGPEHDLTERVETIEIEHERVPIGRAGEPVAIGVKGPVRRGDDVLRIDESGPKE